MFDDAIWATNLNQAKRFKRKPKKLGKKIPKNIISANELLSE